ncbi:MAG: RNA polymerase sigma factor region1.1 domain-containing protein, partial [Phycisphaerae bacterium]|nr:RNA polymerase sigma factor region1.1 domain-containing protein [Phycisphaerae bacterium]
MAKKKTEAKVKKTSKKAEQKSETKVETAEVVELPKGPVPIIPPTAEQIKKSGDIIDEKIKLIIAKAKKKGFITYEEMNNELPDESISPNRLEGLIMTLDEMGISLLDEAEVQKRQEEDGDFDADEDVF